jgi:hypothetical protein
MAFPDEYNIDIVAPSDSWGGVDPDKWKTAVLQTVVKITASEAGMALLRALAKQWDYIKVKPPVKCGAESFPVRDFDSKRQRGYGAVVLFDPFDYLSGSACFVRKPRGSNNHGFLPHEVLFHELIHGHRQTQRLGEPTELDGGLKWYRNQEEFLAIVLTNIYISDVTNRHKSGLRADEYGGRPLEKGLSDSMSFFLSSPQVLPLLSKFRSAQTDLFNALAKVKASFNPLQAMVQHPREVERLSHSKIAAGREKTVPKLDIRPTATHNPTLKSYEAAGMSLAREALRILGY